MVRGFVEDMLTIYWSQTTLILLGIGYLVKKWLDIRSKKKEINHTLFQEKRLSAINRYYTSYAKVEQLWFSIAIWEILKGIYSAKEIDKMVFPPIDELKKNLLELQIYLNEREHEYFERITEHILDINTKLSNVYFSSNPDESHSPKVTEFETFKREMLDENKKLFSEVNSLIKDSFN